MLEQKIISILEVLGIKFTSQSFNIDYCLRQIMIIDEKPLFNKCLIKPQHVMKNKDDHTEKPKETPKETEETEETEEAGEIHETDPIKDAKVTLIINDVSDNIQEKDASDNIQDTSDNIQNTNIQENIKLEEERKALTKQLESEQGNLTQYQERQAKAASLKAEVESQLGAAQANLAREEQSRQQISLKL